MATRVPAVGGVGLIVLCFLGSAALRLTHGGLALAEELDQMTQETAGAPPEQGADALMAALREREKQLDADAAKIADRAQTLNVAEAKLAEQLAAFEKARKQLEATLASADKAAEKDIDRMTTVYENMKPAEAAKILDRMDVSFAAGLMARMRPEIAAQILAGMNPDAAYAVTLTVASRNSRVPTK
ncbi:MAG: hypothetical protein ABTQ27_06230 [Amaricoccus sp.]|uniref:MotE family protein n=1 Tax=Amaricoccus sp. TaxID=1872485 RepID=UPI003315651A